MRSGVFIGYSVATVCFVLSLAGCSSEKINDNVKMDSVKPDDAFVLSSLSRTADNIDKHVRNLERASLRHIKLRSLPAPVGGASYFVTMSFDGPMEEAVTSLGKIIHYKVYFEGKKPAIPIIVSVHERRRTAQSILESIGLQVGRSVGIHMDEVGNRIDVVYENVKNNWKDHP